MKPEEAAVVADSEGSEIVTEDVVNRRLSISSSTNANWRKTGRLPYIRLAGRSIRFHWPSVLAALLRAQRGGGL